MADFILVATPFLEIEIKALFGTSVDPITMSHLSDHKSDRTCQLDRMNSDKFRLLTTKRCICLAIIRLILNDY